MSRGSGEVEGLFGQYHKGVNLATIAHWWSKPHSSGCSPESSQWQSDPDKYGQHKAFDKASVQAKEHIWPGEHSCEDDPTVPWEHLPPGVGVQGRAANPLIGEVVQSPRRPLLGPSPGWKRLLALSHLRHYAKRALTPRSLNVKLGPWRNYHMGWAALRHYANQPAHPLWLLYLCPSSIES